MRKITSLLAAITTALAIITPSLTVSAAPISGLGNIHTRVNEIISPGLEYTELYANDGNDRQHAYVYSFAPNNGTAIMPAWGDGLYGRDRLTSLAKAAINDGYDVVGGINADFFSMQTGVPLGAVISGSELISSDAGANAIGITSAGKVIIGTPEIKITLSKRDGTNYNIPHFNKYPTIYNAYLLTRDFSESTRSTSPSLEIVIRITSGRFSLGEAAYGIIEVIHENSQNTEIPEGCVVLSVNNKSSLINGAESFARGDIVELSFDAGAEWNEVETAVGGGDIIVENGKFVFDSVNEAHEKSANPRSAVGITGNGRILFYAVDGRDPSLSLGQTIEEMAKTLIDLGCVRAINLDGGGSTSFAVRHRYSRNIELAGRPSDGAERGISNALLFVNTAETTEIPHEIALSPSTARVHASGGSITFDGIIRDTAFKIIERDFSDISPTYKIISGGGHMEGNTYFAADTAERVTIMASAYIDGRYVEGNAAIEVVTSLDDFKPIATEYTIPAGTDVKLGFTGYKNGVSVNVPYSIFEYKFNDSEVDSLKQNVLAAASVGYLDDNGIFHSYPDAESGTVTLSVTYGYKTVDIKLNIGMQPQKINDFEGVEELDALFVCDEDASLAYANEGKRSDKSLSFKGKYLGYEDHYSLLYPIEALSMWVKGDIGNLSYARIITADEREAEIYYRVTEDYTDINGWRLIEAVVPENIAQPIKIAAPFVSLSESNIIIDDITVNYGEDARIFTDIKDHWANDMIVSLYNMEISEGSFVGGERVYSPEKQLTRAEFAKMIACYLNLSSSETDETASFTDIDDIPEWAITYVNSVIASGVMSGKSSGDGSLRFAPNDGITRAEVMHVLGKLISSEEKTELAYTDAADIPTWARDNIAKVTKTGIVTGYNDGTLKPNRIVTRAEIAVMLVRLNALN